MKMRWLLVAIMGLAASAALAQTNGVWSGDADGFWTDPVRWSGNNIGSGAGATGNFFTLDITANRTVTLTNQITIGHLLFADTGGGGTLDWILTNAVASGGGSTGSLLLAVSAGVPTIWVTNRNLHIGTLLDGTQGFRKYGPGGLYMGNTNSTLTGPVQIEGGFH